MTGRRRAAGRQRTVDGIGHALPDRWSRVNQIQHAARRVAGPLRVQIQLLDAEHAIGVQNAQPSCGLFDVENVRYFISGL